MLVTVAALIMIVLVLIVGIEVSMVEEEVPYTGVSADQQEREGE